MSLTLPLPNTGEEAVTVFKGNTVFSAHATKDLAVSDHSKIDMNATFYENRSSC